jgi:hypothetical protein
MILSAHTLLFIRGPGNPDYSKCVLLNINELENMKDSEILYSYIIIKGDLSFNSLKKYPSIPCFVDETTTVYPLEGECIFTGIEYILARNQGCNINIKEIFYIPFEKDKENKNKNKNINHPFKSIIKEIQSKRREFAKGTINNKLFKEMGNSIYESIVRGISNKRVFDIKTGKNIRGEASYLSNPMLAS